jgi:hypothetical protein
MSRNELYAETEKEGKEKEGMRQRETHKLVGAPPKMDGLLQQGRSSRWPWKKMVQDATPVGGLQDLEQKLISSGVIGMK